VPSTINLIGLYAGVKSCGAAIDVIAISYNGVYFIRVLETKV